MKKILRIFALTCVLSACNADPLDPVSVIDDPSGIENSFDKWLYENYTAPYNIRFLYKMKDIESSISYTLSPADYTKSTQMARIVKHLCLEAYDEVTGSKDFVCQYFPKMFHLIGSAAYNSDGTIVLGTAEGGMKITLYMVNDVDVENVEMLNYYYFHTIHHEFAHILHQTKSYPVEFEDLSGIYYVQDSWVYNTAYLSQGFVTAYSSKEPNEDFVEVISTYITNTQEYWDSLVESAGEVGGPIIESKLSVCRNYLLKSWGIDIDELRTVIERRSSELGSLGLENPL